MTAGGIGIHAASTPQKTGVGSDHGPNDNNTTDASRGQGVRCRDPIRFRKLEEEHAFTNVAMRGKLCSGLKTWPSASYSEPGPNVAANTPRSPLPPPTLAILVQAGLKSSSSSCLIVRITCRLRDNKFVLIAQLYSLASRDLAHSLHSRVQGWAGRSEPASGEEILTTTIMGWSLAQSKTDRTGRPAPQALRPCPNPCRFPGMSRMHLASSGTIRLAAVPAVLAILLLGQPAPRPGQAGPG